MTVLETKNLDAGYNNNRIISDVSLYLEAGKIVSIIGPNGSGKSTLLKTIAGHLEKMDGKILLFDKEIDEISSLDRAKKMAVMLTGRKETEYTDCYQIVSAGRYPYTGRFGTLNNEDKAVIDEMMRLTNTDCIADKDFQKISDGQKQRVLLARALVQEPKILILDEPTSFLDVGYQLEFMNILKGMAVNRQMGILMSMHELDLTYKISDIVISVTKDGKIGSTGKPKDIMTKEYIGKLFNIKGGSYTPSEGGFEFEVSPDKEPGNKSDKRTEDAGNGKYGNTRFLMVQGTMSSAGKSLITAGLCRVFAQDGYRVAPFKSQNMALNSYITEDGLEMGRAQVMQAECCNIKPDVCMNPILLKPTDDQGSQIIVNGEVIGNMRARDYFEYKKKLIPDIEKAVKKLSEKADIIVIEGAGSPAEINLKENDIVNMGMARLVDAPVILVGDIDRGGVFAQLLGTLELLEENERQRVKGLVVNKFRGDKSILDPGIAMLEEKGNVKVAGVVPYMDIDIEDEDSLSERFKVTKKGVIDIAVIRLPHISNFTDFAVFEQSSEVSVRYIKRPYDLGTPDIIIIPGSKNTISDMKWLRQSGMETMIKKLSTKDVPVVGICGGYQILGKSIADPEGVEGGGEIAGMDMLPVRTVLAGDKNRRQVEGTISGLMSQSNCIFQGLSGLSYYGYEIHMGVTKLCQGETACEFTGDKSGYCKGNVFGTYVHGIFDDEKIVKGVLEGLASRKGISLDLNNVVDFREYKEMEYDRLANVIREYMDMDYLYEVIGINRAKKY